MSLVLVSPALFIATLSTLATSPVNSVASVGGTLQFTAFAWDGIAVLNPPFGNPIQPQPTWTWASTNTGVATINSSTGLATGVSAGVCEIIATATVGLQTFSGSAMFGVTLITPNTATINYGSSQVFTASGNSAQWQSGIPAVAQMRSGNTNVFGTSDGCSGWYKFIPERERQRSDLRVHRWVWVQRHNGSDSRGEPDGK